MTPYEQAQAVYEREPCARSFHEDLWLHLQHGFVYSSPTCFAMAREASSDWPVERMLLPWETETGGNCWFIWLLAGDAREGIAKLPHAKPFIAFEKRGRVSVAPGSRFLQRLKAAAKDSA